MKAEKANLPLITIVTPSYNQGRYLEENIVSILKQDYKRVEHIVLDGGSTDETIAILKKYEDQYDLQWSSGPDDGQSHAINKGFELASGEIVYWLNSDDCLLGQSSLSDIVRIFQADRSIDVVYGNRIAIDGSNELIKLQYTNKFDYSKIKRGIYPIFQENVFFAAHVVKEEKLNTELHVVMDTDYWLRLGVKYKFRFANSTFACFRIHTDNKTVSDNYIERWNLEKDYLNTKYGVHRYKVGKGAQPLRYWHRFISLCQGSYNNYRNIYRDVQNLAQSSSLAVKVKVEPKKFHSYVFNSFRPYTR